MAKNKVVIINDAVLVNLANNPAFIKEFGFLAGARQSAKKGCRCSQKAKNRIAQMGGIKQSLRNMNDAKKLKFKSMLNTEQVKIRMQSGSKIVDYVF